MNPYDEMSRTLQISNTSITKGWYFCQLLNVISRQCQITAHCIHNCIEVQLSELSCLSAVTRFRQCLRAFFFCFFFVVCNFFEVGKKMCRSPPPPPPWICCPFFFLPKLCLFLDGLGALLLGQSALPRLKCPFCKWPCPSKSLIWALLKGKKLTFTNSGKTRFIWLRTVDGYNVCLRHHAIGPS